MKSHAGYFLDFVSLSTRTGGHVGLRHTCRYANEVEWTVAYKLVNGPRQVARVRLGRHLQQTPRPQRPRREPFNATPMGVRSISFGSPHVRPMWALNTCGAWPPDEIKKNTHPKTFTALHRDQAKAKADAEPTPIFDGFATRAIHAGARPCPATGTRCEPFSFTPMGANSIASGPPHVRCTPYGAHVW